MYLLRVTILVISIGLSHAYAGLLKVESGVGVWQSAASGTITSTLNQTLYFQDNLSSHDSVQNGYLYLSVKHPLPIFPNTRFEYVDVSTSGHNVEAGTSTSIPLSSVSVTSNSVSSDLSMRQYDAIFFYNVVDKHMGITVDVGMDIKYLVTDYKINTLSVSSDDSSLIPLVYLRGRMDIPMTPLGVESDIKYITDGSSTVYDIRFKVDYTMKFTPLIHPGLELGYRIQQFTSDGDESALIGPILSSDTNTDIGFSGLYGGLNLKF